MAIATLQTCPEQNPRAGFLTDTTGRCQRLRHKNQNLLNFIPTTYHSDTQKKWPDGEVQHSCPSKHERELAPLGHAAAPGSKLPHYTWPRPGNPSR